MEQKGNSMQTGKAYRYEKVILRPWEWLLREDRGYGKVATVESSLAEGIRQTDLEVQFDACCKRDVYKRQPPFCIIWRRRALRERYLKKRSWHPELRENAMAISSGAIRSRELIRNL